MSVSVTKAIGSVTEQMDWTIKKKKKEKKERNLKGGTRTHSPGGETRTHFQTESIRCTTWYQPTPGVQTNPLHCPMKSSHAKNFAKPLLKPNTAEQLGSTTSVQCHVVRTPPHQCNTTSVHATLPHLPAGTPRQCEHLEESPTMCWVLGTRPRPDATMEEPSENRQILYLPYVGNQT